MTLKSCDTHTKESGLISAAERLRGRKCLLYVWLQHDDIAVLQKPLMVFTANTMTQLLTLKHRYVEVSRFGRCFFH